MDDEVLRLLRQLIREALNSQRDDIDRTVAATASTFSSHGRLASGAFIHQLVRDYGGGLRNFALTVGQQVGGFLVPRPELVQATARNAVVSACLAEFDSAVAATRPGIVDLASRAFQRSGTSPGQLDQHFLAPEHRERNRLQAELLLMLSKPSAASTGQITVNASGMAVGVQVATIDSNMTVTADKAQGVAAAAAFRAFADALRELRTTLPSRELDEVIAVAKEAEQEVAKQEPNRTKLHGLLTGLATSVQTIAAAEAAYNVLRMGLTPFGITLPPWPGGSP